MKTIKGYKFLKSGNKSLNGNLVWKKGVWRKEKEIELCNKGFHASKTPLQSLNYIYGDNWWVVEARGKIIEGNDKFAAQEMRLVKQLDVKKILVKFAFLCTKRCLHNFEEKYPNDKRPRQAIDVAENYLKKPTEKNKKSARSAESAAWSAAESAESAAWSAAESAESAAWSAESAAWSAESAAWSAAWSAEIKWQNKILNKIVKEAEKKVL